MDPERENVFRELLESRLNALLAKAGSDLGSMVDQRESHADAADVATEESNREFALRLHEHDRRTIKQIQAALRRLDAGEYGECIACGEEIGERRLMARPMSSHCIDCKTEMEMTRRAF